MCIFTLFNQTLFIDVTHNGGGSDGSNDIILAHLKSNEDGGKEGRSKKNL